MGTAPTNLTYGGSTWAIGTATKGPGDGLTYLATSPASGTYPNVVNDWAMLPAVDLSAYSACQLRMTVELWRDAEKYGLVNYDGGNLQYTTDAAGAGGWAIVGGMKMAYDGVLTDCIPCIVLSQQTWTSSANPKWKTAIYEGAMPLGPVVRLRFTFHSDISNELGPLAGIYVRRLQVEVY